MTDLTRAESPRRAIVAFTDDGSHILSGLLRPGFRHCFAAVDDGRSWILVDGRDGIPVVQAVQHSTFDLATFWRAGAGCTVVEAHQGAHPLRAPLAFTNCVGLVKAVLCIRAPLAVTPWQLFKVLQRSKSR